MDFTGKQENIEKIIKNVASDLNYLIYDSSIYLKGNNSKITVKIDKLQGITHQDCDIYSKEIVTRLDKEEILPNYSLEVSSPGMSRKLRSIDEFIRFKNSLVKVIFDENGERKVIKGIINNIIDTNIELQSDNSEIIIIEYNNIVKANLEY
ncbi:MAG: hypothetical protein JW864_16885 [Spirochaetes bacterium]|nr:hypothetical protein [Spirochaetota bacterium]